VGQTLYKAIYKCPLYLLTYLFTFLLVGEYISADINGLITRQRFHLDLRSLLNTNRKSYLASQTQPPACCSDDRKCPKSRLAPTDIGTRHSDAAITRIWVLTVVVGLPVADNRVKRVLFSYWCETQAVHTVSQALSPFKQVSVN